MDDPIAIAIVATILVVSIGRLVGGHWVIREYRAGRMPGRRAGWLIFVFTVAPYLLLFLWMVAASPGQWWIAVLLFIASWPIIVMPWVVVLYGNRIRKPPG